MRNHIGLLVGCLVMLGAASALGQVSVEQLAGNAIEKPDAAQFNDVALAIETFFGGDTQGARELLDTSKKKNAALPPTGVMLSQLFFAVNQMLNGRSALEQATVDDPNDPEAYLMFGDLAIREGRLTDAGAVYRQGLQLCEKLVGNDFRKRNLQINAHAGLTAVAGGRQQWKVADQHAQAWVALDPQSVAAHTQLGRVLFFSQQYQSAYAEFQTAYKVNSKIPLPEINMAMLYEELVEQGDESKRASARKAMEMAATNDPDNLETRLAIARWALDACEIDMADENVKAAAGIDNASVDAKLLVGVIARHRNDLPAAEAALREVHLQAPTNFEVIRQLSLVFVAQQDAAKRRLAIDYAELNFRANTDQNQFAGREAAITLAWVFFALGRGQDALSTVQNALRAGNVSDESTYLAARILSENKQEAAALSILRPMLAAKRCFPLRSDAEALLAKLAGE